MANQEQEQEHPNSNTNELYDVLVLYQAATIYIQASQYEALRKRLIKKRHREKSKLGELADGLKLHFKELDSSNDLDCPEDSVKVRITLTDPSEEVSMTIIPATEDF